MLVPKGVVAGVELQTVILDADPGAPISVVQPENDMTVSIQYLDLWFGARQLRVHETKPAPRLTPRLDPSVNDRCEFARLAYARVSSQPGHAASYYPRVDKPGVCQRIHSGESERSA
jgi:hypothetical protein